MPCIGKPQWGQVYALSDTVPEHSGQVVSAMLSPFWSLAGVIRVSEIYLTYLIELTIMYLTRQLEKIAETYPLRGI